MKSLLQSVTTRAPGVLLSTLLAVIAVAIAKGTSLPVMIIAILMGLSLYRVNQIPALQPGFLWASKPLLNIAVALLGLRIDLSVISQYGFTLPVLACVVLLLTIFGGYLIGRRFKIETSFSVLMSGATAICGVSAAAAIASVLPDYKNRDNHLTLTIGGVTILSTLAMIIYPAITHFMHFNDIDSGIIMGASIHNVSQAVGAGYAVSDTAGNMATVVKLLRVSLLFPVILTITLLYSASNNAQVSGESYGIQRQWLSYFPPFLIVFFGFAALNNFGVLPSSVQRSGAILSEWFLIISIVAIGIRTNMRNLIKIGPKPLIVMTLTSIYMLAVAVTAIFAIEFIAR